MKGQKHIIRYHVMAMACIQGIVSLQENKQSGFAFIYPNLNATAYLSDRVKGDKVKANAGFEVTVVFEGEYADNVVEMSNGIVRELMDHVSFITSAHCDIPRIESHIVINDDGKSMGTFYSQPDTGIEIIVGTPNKIDRTVFETFEKACEDNQHKGRISRSLAWFRKGIGERRILDQFISFWVSIEVVKHILRRKLQMSIREPAEWDGVKDVFTRKITSVNFEDLFTARQEILHGYEEISPIFITKIRNYIDPMRKAIIYCIGSILDLKDDCIDTIAGYSPRRLFTDYSLGLKGVFENLPSDIDKLLQRYPEIITTVKLRDYRLREEKLIDYNFDTSYKAVLPEKTTFLPTGLELEEEGHAGIVGFRGEIHD